MNERIFELARAAELNATLLFNPEKLEKFTHAIVQELITITNDTDSKWDPDDLIEKFKQHFDIV